ncbi:MAG TPA: NAD(P)/FAD-dependent oxidoreductase [Solirubrobacterales bacterium]|jgi:pyruvate/2-oxoglutarate dehydrogenase complex dihydrolipoamide dehydrogenase (E3) component|nr:NAD(P)/FAD-dependent oxidoreductase [Solirubrobacterales bacterium]
MSERFDAIVIGAGPAGEVCAGHLAEAGMSVAVAERELVAGECSYWACMPSKTLLRPGEAVAQARHAPGAREAVTGEIDRDEALEWRNKVVSGWDDSGHVDWLEQRGITLLRGDARIAAAGSVEVGGEAHETDRIVVATGSDPAFPPIEGLDGLEGVWTNREVTGMKRVPDSILILGGGPVGVEMAQALTRFGADVTVVEAADRLLGREAPAVGEALADALREEGVELRLGAQAEAADKQGDGYALRLAGGGELSAEKLLVATGRKPRLDVGMDNVGIEPGKRGIEVDERLRAGDGVWAIGDVTGIMPFTHVGKYQARIAAEDMLGNEARADYRAVPRVVFTDPQVAAVGESDGKRTGTAELSGLARTSTWARNGEARGFLTLVSDGEILTGAYALGPEAGDWLQQATLAIRAGVHLDLLRDTIQPFPTFSEAYPSALADLS